MQPLEVMAAERSAAQALFSDGTPPTLLEPTRDGDRWPIICCADYAVVGHETAGNEHSACRVIERQSPPVG